MDGPSSGSLSRGGFPSTDSSIIRGIGLVTPLGLTAESTWTALVDGGAISSHARVPINPTTDRLHTIASSALEQAIAQGALTSAELHGERTALIFATSRGPVDGWIEHWMPAASFGLSDSTARLAQAFRIGSGPRLTVSCACASGLHAIIRAHLLLQSGEADRILVVAGESSMHPMLLQSFQRLGVTAPQGERCRPFDADRQGLLVSEGAAAVVLERGGAAPLTKRSGIDQPLRIDGYAFAGDASHLTGLNPDGQTLRRIYGNVVGAGVVDLFHAHGTGTPMNDAVEADAIASICVKRAAVGGMSAETGRSEPPLVYSHKGAIGHTLGASSLISFVLNVLMHERAIVPAIAGLRSPIAMPGATLVDRPTRRTIRRSIACAAGFGGAVAAVGVSSL